MNRIINVKVGGNHLSKDNKYAGVKGEGNVAYLRISFSDDWEAYTKKVTFWDAKGENPVVRQITLDLLENAAESENIYLVPIPFEPMAEAGEMSFVIEGYIEGKRQRSYEAKLLVEYAPITDEENEPEEPTPTQIEQLQAEIEYIKGNIVAVKSIESKVDKINYYGLTFMEPEYDEETEVHSWDKFHLETKPEYDGEIVTMATMVYSADGADKKFATKIEMETYVDEKTEVIRSDVEGIQQQMNEESHFRGYVSTNAKIQALEATPNDFAYSAESGTMWIYEAQNGWHDTGIPFPDQLTPASETTPLINGTASVGSENAYARGDHRHPTDTTRASVEDLRALDDAKVDKTGGKEQLGLGKVDNTADIDKPISAAVSAALAQKIDSDTYENEKQLMANEIDSKVDSVSGKGLSTNDFTNEYKYMLDSPDLVIEQYLNWLNEPETDIYTPLSLNKQHICGEKATVRIVCPSDAKAGDVVYLSFISGNTPTNLTIDTTNTCDIELIPEANTHYEIFGKFNGSIWLINYSEYTVSEG